MAVGTTAATSRNRTQFGCWLDDSWVPEEPLELPDDEDDEDDDDEEEDELNELSDDEYEGAGAE
mgnify:CR=1 FL=1